MNEPCRCDCVLMPPKGPVMTTTNPSFFITLTPVPMPLPFLFHLLHEEGGGMHNPFLFSILTRGRGDGDGDWGRGGGSGGS